MRVCFQSFAIIVLAISVAATLSWAGSALDVGSLLATPESYQSRVVRVTGIVANHKMRHLRGETTEKCFQLFTLNDETGSIQVAYRSNCAGAKTSLRNRDVVTVEARFEWTPGQSGLLKVQSVLAKVAPSAQ
jgi:cytochrome c-type biogenesis protein CcmE